MIIHHLHPSLVTGRTMVFGIYYVVVVVFLFFILFSCFDYLRKSVVSIVEELIKKFFFFIIIDASISGDSVEIVIPSPTKWVKNYGSIIKK